MQQIFRPDKNRLPFSTSFHAITYIHHPFPLLSIFHYSSLGLGFPGWEDSKNSATKSHNSTALFIHSVARLCRLGFGEFTWIRVITVSTYFPKTSCLKPCDSVDELEGNALITCGKAEAWHFQKLRGHGNLQTASEVTYGLRFELSDLNDLCSHVFWL